jgi:Putative prokaryotic signal transducing protein
VTRLFDWTEAEMLRGRLEAEGVPAIVADAYTARAIPLYLAIGGVRVMVPEAYLERAREILKADARGDYALDDRTDVGPPTDTP